MTKGKLTLMGTGTSQGVPVISCNCTVCHSTNPKDKRLRCAALVETDSVTFVIDCGPDFRQQCLTYKVNFVNSIFLTHEHMDHVAGIDDIRPFNYIQNHVMPIYGEGRVLDTLKKTFGYIFNPSAYSGLPLVELNNIQPYETIFQGNLPVLPLRIMHGNLPILGYKIGNLAYITDAKSINKETTDYLKDCDTVILNALHHRFHLTHFNLDEVLKYITGHNLKRVYLTHCSHQMGLHDEVNNKLPDHVQLAYDGLEIEFLY